MYFKTRTEAYELRLYHHVIHIHTKKPKVVDDSTRTYFFLNFVVGQ